MTGPQGRGHGPREHGHGHREHGHGHRGHGSGPRGGCGNGPPKSGSGPRGGCGNSPPKSGSDRGACGSANAYRHKHKDTVDEICRLADGVLANHCSKHGHEHGAVTAGTIKNTSKSEIIKLQTKHDWSGHNHQNYPEILPKGQSGSFVHASDPGKVDEGAVVYFDERGCAWLLAWSVTDKPDGYNKVYVETGSIEDYKIIDWDKIKILLDVSTDTTYAVDYDHDNEAFATITTLGNQASIGATFNSYK